MDGNLLGVILGALITTVIALALESWRQSYVRKHNKEDILREKMEDLYNCTIRLQNEYLKLYQNAVYRINLKRYIPDSVLTSLNAFVQMQMIINLYFPKEFPLQNLQTKLKNFGDIFERILHVPLHNNEENESTLNDLNNECHNVIEEINKLQKNISETFKLKFLKN